MTVKDVANFLMAKNIVGDESTEITSFSPITDIESQSLVCVDNAKYLDLAINSKASVLIIKQEMEYKTDKVLIIVDNPKEAFLRLLTFFYPDEESCYGKIGNTAVIDKTAIVSKTAYIGEHVCIGKNTVIGDKTVIDSGCIIYDNVVIGSDCHIFSNVSIREGCILKDRIIIGSSSVIGTDGFGYIPVDGKHVKVPQKGNVIIESDCELGASVTIDRATLGSTKIGCGVKIDNSVQIAHNCQIGSHTIIVSQAGIAGSSIIGNHCIIGGQVGISDHVKIGDGVAIVSQSGLMANTKVASGSVIYGSPIQDINREKLCQIAYRKLPELISAVEDKLSVKIKAPKK